MATSKTISSHRLAALHSSVDSARLSLARVLCFLDHVSKCCEHEGAQGELPTLVDAGRRLGYTAFGQLKVYATERQTLEQVNRSRHQLRELLAVVSAADAIRDPGQQWATFLAGAVQDVTAAIQRLSVMLDEDQSAVAQAA